MFQEELWKNQEGCWQEVRLVLAPGGTLGARAGEILEVSGESSSQHQAGWKGSCRLHMSCWLPLFSTFLRVPSAVRGLGEEWATALAQQAFRVAVARPRLGDPAALFA